MAKSVLFLPLRPDWACHALFGACAVKSFAHLWKRKNKQQVPLQTGPNYNCLSVSESDLKRKLLYARALVIQLSLHAFNQSKAVSLFSLIIRVWCINWWNRYAVTNSLSRKQIRSHSLLFPLSFSLSLSLVPKLDVFIPFGAHDRFILRFRVFILWIKTQGGTSGFFPTTPYVLWTSLFCQVSQRPCGRASIDWHDKTQEH